MTQTILITGCSSGIGYHTALALKNRGYRVFTTARKASDIEKLKAQGLEALALDINDSASIQQVLQEILQRTGGSLSAVFSNAGFLEAGAIEDLSRDVIRAQFETNVFGAMELITRIIPIMRQQGHGRIIVNSSILGIVTIPYCGAYNASKFALEGFIRTLRQELYATPIRVSIIAPGPITSELRKNAYQLYHQHLKNQPSTYAKEYQQLEKYYFHAAAKNALALEPEAVTKKLIHALESRHPKVHYYIGFTAHLLAFLRRILPDAMLDWALRKTR